MALAAGDRIDRYEIVQFLGSGGMGEVYRAHDPKLQRSIALKVLRSDGSLATGGRVTMGRRAVLVPAKKMRESMMHTNGLLDLKLCCKTYRKI